MKATIKNTAILEAYNALNQISDRDDLPWKLMLKISRLLRAFRGPAEDYQNARQKLTWQYSERVGEDRELRVIDPEGLSDELRKLGEDTTEIEFNPFPLAELKAAVGGDKRGDKKTGLKAWMADALLFAGVCTIDEDDGDDDE